MRFGRWQEILEEPEPADYLPFTLSIHHAARAVALAALDRPEEARVEQQAFSRNQRDGARGGLLRQQHGVAIFWAWPTASSRVRSSTARVRRVPESMCCTRRRRARMPYNYDEPPDWIQPIRHALGATLMQEGRFADAEAVYREDLRAPPRQRLVAVRPRARSATAGRADEAAEVEHASMRCGTAPTPSSGLHVSASRGVTDRRRHRWQPDGPSLRAERYAVTSDSTNCHAEHASRAPFGW